MQKSLPKNKSKIKIVIIGSGNLAWHLVSHLSFFKRFDILVYNQTLSPNLNSLQKEFKVDITNDWKKIPSNAGFYFIATNDESVKATAAKIQKFKTKGLVLHSSGTLPLSGISGLSKNTGVFYPLQTFTFGQSVNWWEVPIFIEAGNSYSLDNLQRLAGLFSNSVVKLNSQQRAKLHLAAVVAGNFSNAMYSAAYLFLENELDKGFFNYLVPLITKTAKKTRSVDPLKAQTGPVARKDKHTQKVHLQLLKKHPDLKKLYKTISKLIIKQQKNNAKL
jgi:predicted short-subunit dehydrogenase-like oxidoreductase (DUF2520 family)